MFLVRLIESSPDRIVVQSTTPARLQDRRGDAVAGAPVVDGGVGSPALWMRFDEALSTHEDFTRESVKGSKCAIGGAEGYWRKGVSGTCPSFDGYANRVTVPAWEPPDIRGDFTLNPLTSVCGLIKDRHKDGLPVGGPGAPEIAERLVEEQYDTTRRWLDLVTRTNPGGVIQGGLADHESLELPPLPALVTPLYHETACLASRLAGLLGRLEDEVRYQELAASIAAA